MSAWEELWWAGKIFTHKIFTQIFTQNIPTQNIHPQNATCTRSHDLELRWRGSCWTTCWRERAGSAPTPRSSSVASSPFRWTSVLISCHDDHWPTILPYVGMNHQIAIELMSFGFYKVAKSLCLFDAGRDSWRATSPPCLRVEGDHYIIYIIYKTTQREINLNLYESMNLFSWKTLF